jgi:GNAT superfamily N-acetyltransferase
MPEGLSILPANRASWSDLQATFGTRGEAGHCQCQWFKCPGRASYRELSQEERAHRLRAQTGCDQPDADATTGLVAFLDGEPAGWCNVEPRAAFVRLRRLRIPWAGRDEDPDDPEVWAVPCFVTRPGFRRRGIAGALARAAVGFARERGAGALEGYPMIVRPGQEIAWGELFVGSRGMFAAAGFAEVSHPTPRRVVMRIDFAPAQPRG